MSEYGVLGNVGIVDAKNILFVQVLNFLIFWLKILGGPGKFFPLGGPKILGGPRTSVGTSKAG